MSETQITTTTIFANAVVRSLDAPYGASKEALRALVRMYVARAALRAIEDAMEDERVIALVEAIGEEAKADFFELLEEVSQMEYVVGGSLARVHFQGMAGRYGPDLARAAMRQAAFTLWNGEWELERAAALDYQPGGHVEHILGDDAFYEERIVADALEFMVYGLKKHYKPYNQERYKAAVDASVAFVRALKEKAWPGEVEYLAKQALEETERLLKGQNNE